MGVWWTNFSFLKSATWGNIRHLLGAGARRTFAEWTIPDAVICMSATRATIGATLRMVAVMAFLIGMPIWALSGARFRLKLVDSPPPAAIPSDVGTSAAKIVPVDSYDSRPGSDPNAAALPPDGQPTAEPVLNHHASRITGDRLKVPDNGDWNAPGREINSPPSIPRGEGNSLHPSMGAIRSIQQQLVRCGAQSMLLEVQNTDPQRYRFRCQMPISTSRIYGRSFEALAADPVLAMKQVLVEIEAWQRRVPNSTRVR